MGGHPSPARALRRYAVAAALAATFAALVTGAGALATVESYRDVVLADGPAGYWRLGETTGATAADATANANGGTYLNGVVLGIPGALPSDADTAARFDGGNDLVSVGDPASGVLDFGTGDFSVEAWFATTTNGESAIFGKKSAEPHWQVTVTDDPNHAGQVRAALYDGTTSRLAYSSARVDDGAWHHLVAVYDRDTAIRIYVDGVAAGSTAGATPTDISNTAPFQIGKTSGYGHFKGEIDEVALYPVVLMPDRIYARYAASGRDTTTPVVTLTAPAAGSATNDTTPTFAGTAGLALGDSPSVTVDVFAGAVVGGTPVETLTAPRAADGSYAVEATAALADGVYTAQATQADSGGNTGSSGANTFTIDAAAPPPPPPPVPDPVLVGAGDIASCGTGGQAEATASLLDALPAATVFTLGDNAYSNGTAAEFQCYDASWGRHKARTRPSVGGHEYDTPGASGYYDYFGAAAGDPSEGWYSYDLGGWHIIVLNTYCAEIPDSDCDAGSPQEQWLRADLAAHQTDCTLAYGHNPLFSSGRVHGSNEGVRPLWQALYDYGADVIVNGHEHVYERFLPQTPGGALDTAFGITQFTVGTGGFMFYDWGRILTNSVARNNTAFGVLKLTLHRGSYDWEFLPIAGKTYDDSGTASCHGAPGAPPPPDTTPPNVTLTSPAAGSSTADTTPAFAGVAGTAPGDATTVTVNVYAGSDAVGAPLQTSSATRAADGSYAVDASPALASGSYTAQAEQSDAAGNVGRSAPSTFTVDAPPLVTLTAPADGSSTEDTTPTFAGVAGTAPDDTAMVTVKVYAGSAAAGTPLQTLMAVPAVDGSYAVAETPELALGTYTAQAEQVDAAGGTGRSAPSTFTIADLTAPLVTLTTPPAGSWTFDATPTFAGTAGTAVGDAASVTVKVYAGGAATGVPVRTLVAVWAADGSYAVDATPALAGATYTAQAEQSDAAGNTGRSAPSTFTIVDTTAPVVTLSSPAAGSSTADTTPAFAGVAGTELGDATSVTVKVYAGSAAGGVPLQTLTATTAAGGSYAVSAAPALAPGLYTADAEQSDAAGNMGRSEPRTFTVTTYRSVVMADAPRAYWRVGEASGTVAADETATAPGTYEGTVVRGVAGAIAGVTNTAVRFDSSNDRISMGDPANGALDFGAADFSVEAWIKTTSNGGQVAVGKAGSGPGWSISVSGATGHVGEIRATVADGVVTRQAYGPAMRVDNGIWHHVVVAVDRGTGITVHVDGLSLATAGPTTGSVSNAAAFQLGRLSGSNAFRGEIDEVAVYPTFLSAARVRAHFDAGRGI